MFSNNLSSHHWLFYFTMQHKHLNFGQKLCCVYFFHNANGKSKALISEIIPILLTSKRVFKTLSNIFCYLFIVLENHRLLVQLFNNYYCIVMALDATSIAIKLDFWCFVSTQSQINIIDWSIWSSRHGIKVRHACEGAVHLEPPSHATGFVYTWRIASFDNEVKFAR